MKNKDASDADKLNACVAALEGCKTEYQSKIDNLNKSIEKVSDTTKKSALQNLTYILVDFLQIYTDIQTPAPMTFSNGAFKAFENNFKDAPLSNILDISFPVEDLYNGRITRLNASILDSTLTPLSLPADSSPFQPDKSGGVANYAATSGWKWNFQVNFNKICAAINQLITTAQAGDAITCNISSDNGTNEAWDCTCGSTCCDLSQIINADNGKPVTSSSVTSIQFSGFGESSLSKVIIPESSLPKLKSLCLDNNVFTAVPDLSNLTALTCLSLVYNTISDWTNLSILTGLTQLDISNTGLTAVPAELTKLGSLTALYLARNQINADAGWSNLANLTDLTQLDISNTGLTAVPDLSNLTALKGLYLDSNTITDNWTNLANLKDLTQLDISNTGLTAVPDVLAQLTDLTGLYLGRNAITDKWSNLANLKGLTQLDISTTGLTAVPQALTNLTALKGLYLDSNAINDWSKLSELTDLKTLNLGSNGLATVPDLSSLTALKNLSLAYNKINNWTNLSGLTDLTSLDLSGNSLTTVSDELSTLTNLIELDMSSNMFTAWSQVTGLNELKNLTFFSFIDNPTTCDYTNSKAQPCLKCDKMPEGTLVATAKCCESQAFYGLGCGCDNYLSAYKTKKNKINKYK